jgi:hypothetical protein
MDPATALRRQRRAEETAKAHRLYAETGGERGVRPEQPPGYDTLSLEDAAKRLAYTEESVGGMTADWLYNFVTDKLIRRRARSTGKTRSSGVIRLDDLVGGRGAAALYVPGRFGDAFDFRFPRPKDEDRPSKEAHARELRRLVDFFITTHRQSTRSFPSAPTSCGRCGRPLGAENRCSACRWLRLPTAKVGADDFIDAVDVEAATVERLVTGGPWDACFGGGLVATSTTLLGARPGLGKSTLALQLSAAVAELRGRGVLYLNVEQSGAEVRLTIQRLGLAKRGSFHLFANFARARGIRGDEFNGPPAAIVIDSLTALAGRDPHAAVEIAKRCKRYAARYSVPALLVCHVIKQDDLMAGLMELQHETDATITLGEGEGAVRTLVALKHRFAPTHQESRLLMTATGLVADNH